MKNKFLIFHQTKLNLRLENHQTQSILNILHDLFQKVNDMNHELEDHYLVYTAYNLRIRSLP